MPNIRWLVALITHLHRFAYRVSGGRLGARLGNNDMLLLHTVGRKTGKPRVTPLLCVPDGESWLVIASNAGDDRPPAWWLNVQAKPDVEIQVGRRRLAVRARTAEADERPELWRKAVDAYPDYAEYEKRTERPIPVVVLEPADP